MIIFFFSGHGYNGYFLPHDYDGRIQMLYHKEVRKMFSLSPAGRKLVFADACRAGSIKIETSQANTPFGLEAYYERLKRKKGGIALMLSSRWNQNYLEVFRLNNGLFTHYLLKGLKGQAIGIVLTSKISINEKNSRHSAMSLRPHTSASNAVPLWGSFRTKFWPNRVRAGTVK